MSPTRPRVSARIISYGISSPYVTPALRFAKQIGCKCRCARKDICMDFTREQKLCYDCMNNSLKVHLTFMTTLEQAAEKLDFKRILPILVIVLVDLMGLSIIIPLLPLFAARFGATPIIIGILQATYPMMQFVGAPILGRLSDR